MKMYKIGTTSVAKQLHRNVCERSVIDKWLRSWIEWILHWKSTWMPPGWTSPKQQSVGWANVGLTPPCVPASVSAGARPLGLTLAQCRDDSTDVGPTFIPGGGDSLYEGYYICSSVSTPLFQVSGKFVEFRPLYFSKNEENVVFWPLYFSKNEENVVFRPLFFIKIGQNV